MGGECWGDGGGVDVVVVVCSTSVDPILDKKPFPIDTIDYL